MKTRMRMISADKVSYLCRRGRGACGREGLDGAPPPPPRDALAQVGGACALKKTLGRVLFACIPANNDLSSYKYNECLFLFASLPQMKTMLMHTNLEACKIEAGRCNHTPIRVRFLLAADNGFRVTKQKEVLLGLCVDLNSRWELEGRLE